MPPAARLTDLHTCEAPPGHCTPIVTSATSVNIGFMPAVRAGDTAACSGKAEIAEGSPTVFIEGAEAARLGDPTEPKGMVVTGFPTVFIGSTPEIDAMIAAAGAGVPFLECKSCQRAFAASTAPASTAR
jgi:uncharacterized Zn-binding protein involved in type VI secretion